MTVRIALIAMLTTICGWSVCWGAQPVDIVPSHSIENPSQPQAAIDEQGTIYVTFGAAETIYCCKSTDGGLSYEKPIRVGEVKRLALGMRRGPRVVAGKEAVVITAIGHDQGNVFAWRSTDQGGSWEGPVTVNDSPGDAREGLHAMAMSPTEEIFCVWLDLRNQGTQIYGAESADGGVSWSENRRIYQSPDESVCECCHPSVTYDRAGHVHVMWRNSIGGYRDMYRTVSRDGQTFDDGVKLGKGTWKLDACPMDGGSIVATGTDEITTIWRREKQVFLTSKLNSEQLIGPGEQPWAAATKAGAYLVWISERPGELWLKAPHDKQPRKLASDATDPVVAVAPNRAGAVVVWEAGRGTSRTLKAQMVE